MFSQRECSGIGFILKRIITEKRFLKKVFAISEIKPESATLLSPLQVRIIRLFLYLLEFDRTNNFLFVFSLKTARCFHKIFEKLYSAERNPNEGTGWWSEKKREKK